MEEKEFSGKWKQNLNAIFKGTEHIHILEIKLKNWIEAGHHPTLEHHCTHGCTQSAEKQIFGACEACYHNASVSCFSLFSAQCFGVGYLFFLANPVDWCRLETCHKDTMHYRLASFRLGVFPLACTHYISTLSLWDQDEALSCASRLSVKDIFHCKNRWQH